MQIFNWVTEDMDEQRLKAWCAGTLQDSELTNSEVDWLCAAAFEAVSKKQMAAAHYNFLQESVSTALN